MKRKLAWLLTLLMVGQMVSCAGSTNEEQTTTNTSTTETKPVETEITSGLGEADFGGYAFHIYAFDGANFDSGMDFNAEELTGEPINDAKYQRVAAVQDAANCTIEQVVTTCTEIRKGHQNLGIAVQAGTNDYDLTCLMAYASCNALVAGYLQNMNDLPNLDLSREWWDQRAVEEFTFKDSVYQVTGDISIKDNDATYCIYFNKAMATDYGMEDFYAMVDDGTWTIDNFRTFAEMVAVSDTDNDGNHINDADDLYGIYIWDDIMMGIVNSAGIRCCTIDEDGMLQLSLFSERFVNAFEKFSSYAFNKDVTCEYQRVGYDQQYGRIAFKENRALFYLAWLEEAVSLRDMEEDFGILPLPKYDEDLDRYYNSAASWLLALYSVPKNAFGEEELARTGYITQALAFESMKVLTSAYYEQTLQNKVSRDENSARMLDLLFTTRTYDFGWYFEIGGYNEGIMNLLRSYSTDVVSMYEREETKAQATLDDYNEVIYEQLALEE